MGYPRNDNPGIPLVCPVPTGDSDISRLSHPGRICPSSDPRISRRNVPFCVRIRISKFRPAMETTCRIQHTVADRAPRANRIIASWPRSPSRRPGPHSPPGPTVGPRGQGPPIFGGWVEIRSSTCTASAPIVSSLHAYLLPVLKTGRKQEEKPKNNSGRSPCMRISAGGRAEGKAAGLGSSHAVGPAAASTVGSTGVQAVLRALPPFIGGG